MIKIEDRKSRDTLPLRIFLFVQGKYENGNRQGQGELVKVDGEVSCVVHPLL